MNPTFKQAFSDRWTSMRRKLPIIIAAAFACYGLYYLDLVKRRFDEEKSTPVLINQNVKARLGVLVGNEAGKETWDDIKDFIVVDQYTAESDFINKVAARISGDAQAKEFVAQERFRKCVAKALEPSLIDPESCAENYLTQNKAAHVKAENRIANVYRYIKPLNLKAESRKAQEAAGVKVTPQREKWYVESSLQPILNEQGGVHIIYQILRIALIVVIAFALISVMVLLLTTVMLSDGIKVLTEHATSFIGLGKSSIGPAAKVGVLSVAALGLGGAFVAGTTTTTSATEPAAYQREGGMLKSPNPALPPGRTSKDPARPNVTHHDGSNIQYSFGDSGNIYDNSQKTSLAGENPFQDLNVKVFPEVSVPRLDPIESHVSLDPSVTDSLRVYLESLRSLNQELARQVAALAAPQVKDDIKVSNLLKNPIEKDPLLILDAAKGPISDSISRVETNLNPIKDVATSLADFQVTSLDTPANPNARPFLVRLFRGPNKYFVSKRSLEQLEEIKKGRQALRHTEIQQLRANAGDDSAKQLAIASTIAHLEWKIAADDVILLAVKDLYLEVAKPTDADTFYKSLRDTLTRLLGQSKILPEKHPDTLERLKYWRDTILTYTRID